MKEYQNKIEKIKEQIASDLEDLSEVIQKEEMTAELIEEEINYVYNFIEEKYLTKMREIEEEGYKLTSEEAFNLRYDILEDEMMGN